MQNVKHIAQNTGHITQNDGHTMQNVGCTTHNVGSNILNVCQGPKGGLEVPPPTPILEKNFSLEKATFN